MDDYTIEETEDSYEIYLSHRAAEQGISVWFEEDNTFDEIQQNLDIEKNNDYEMD